MPLKTTCDHCGRSVIGVFTKLAEVDGEYLCPTCAQNAGRQWNYYCTACHTETDVALMKGSNWIEVVLYLFYILPGVLYSLWRRSGPQNMCHVCGASALVPIALAPPEREIPPAPHRNERECPFCAELILAKAKLCKHCGQSIPVA